MKLFPTKFFRKIPGFRSGKWWKALIASSFYLFLLLILVATIVPSAPTLALDEIKPTNQSTVLISGKTYSSKSVYLLQNDEVVQSAKADSKGNFFFGLNDLPEGNFPYTIQACRSEERKHCSNENILVTVDTTPPVKPVVEIPSELPEEEGQEIVIKGITDPNAKVIVRRGDTELPEVHADEKGEFEIKTGLILGVNTVAVKAIDDVGNESETTVSEINFNPIKHKARVIKVIDGDTIEIEGGQRVRYIGIDTPETVHPSKPVECYGKEASDKNKELVEGKMVTLEKDVSKTDKYGRLLRYVWLGDMMVNEYLVREGYAQSSTYPPDVKYQDRFVEAQRRAREEEKGLWSSYCDNWGKLPTSTPAPVKGTQSQPTSPPIQPPAQPITQPPQPPPDAGGYTCDCSKTCPQMSSCAEAQYQLNVCDCTRRDRDKDGIACDVDCQ